MESNSSLRDQAESEDSHRIVAARPIPRLPRTQSLVLARSIAAIEPGQTRPSDPRNPNPAATQVSSPNVSPHVSNARHQDPQRAPVPVSGLASLRVAVEQETSLRDARIVDHISGGLPYRVAIFEDVDRPPHMIESLFEELTKKAAYDAEVKVCEQHLGARETARMGLESSFLFLSSVHGRDYVSNSLSASTLIQFER